MCRCIPMLSAIKSPERLRLILATVSHYYLKEYRDNKKTVADAANIDDGTVEKGLVTNFSTSNDN